MKLVLINMGCVIGANKEVVTKTLLYCLVVD